MALKRSFSVGNAHFAKKKKQKQEEVDEQQQQ